MLLNHLKPTFFCNTVTAVVAVYRKKNTAGQYPRCKSDAIDYFVKVMTISRILYRSDYGRRLTCVFICFFSLVRKLGQYHPMSYSYFT